MGATLIVGEEVGNDHLTAEDVQACLAYAADVLQSEKVYALPR
jgi:hypothetical protein